MAQIKRGGTRLSTLPQHVLWLECRCGRNAPVRVSALLAMDEPPAIVADAVARVRCSHCGQRNVKHYRIVYNPDDGSAFEAMRGSEHGQD